MEILCSDSAEGNEAMLFAWVENTLNASGLPRVTAAAVWGNPLAAHICAFRRGESLRTAPHLLSDTQEEIEARLSLDARSLHFAAYEGEEIVASIRLTPAPFETAALPVSRDLNLAALHQHYEFSRLTTRWGYARKAIAARQLLLGCGLWLFRNTAARGIFGICARDRESFFSRFGVNVIEGDASFRVEGRGSTDYRLVCGDRSRILNKIRQSMTSRRSRPMVDLAPDRRWV